MICATRALGITYQNLLLRNVCGIHVYFVHLIHKKESMKEFLTIP